MLNILLSNIWGALQTECAPVISTNLYSFNKEGSVGKLMPNCEAKTVDGELWVKGSSVMMGYYKIPEEIENKLSENRIVQEVLVRERLNLRKTQQRKSRDSSRGD